MIQLSTKFMFLLTFAVMSLQVRARIIPFENDTLNYRLVGFSVPAMGNGQYTFEIATGRIDDEQQFARSILANKKTTENRAMICLPYFGKNYTWRVSFSGDKKRRSLSALYHFYVGSAAAVDTSLHRARIIEPAFAHKNLLVLLDHQRALIDMEGRPVWYLPLIPGVVDSMTGIRDLKPTSRGTFTFLTDKNGYEIDYDGRVLWTTPNTGKISKDTSEHYHHEFTRLSGGHYMIAGNEYIERKIPGQPDSNIYKYEAGVRKDAAGNYFKKIECGTLIEYDSSGNIVWSWHSSEIFTDEDLFTQKTPAGAVNSSTHQNGFFFDEKKRVVYVSFRDISRVMKIEYPSGRLLRSYGNEGGEDTTSLFRAQHNCFINSSGDLCLFDNHVPSRKHRDQNRGKLFSSVKIFREPAGNSGSLTTIWEFPCNIDSLAGSLALRGGSVFELPDKSILVSMGGINRVFIVSPDKKILWNALFEIHDAVSPGWRPVGSYRASAIPEILPFVFRRL